MGLICVPAFFLLSDEADELEVDELEPLELLELPELLEPLDEAEAVADDSFALHDDAWLVAETKDADPLKEQSDLFLPFDW